MHGYACMAEFALAEVVTSCLNVVILSLSILEGEVSGRALACKITAVGVFTTSSIGTGIGHLVAEISVMLGNAAPA
jgi:hypothetical protein